MLLQDSELRKWGESQGIVPFDPTLVNPASVDLRLGGEFVDLTTGRRFKADEITIQPGHAVLATTLEYLTLHPMTAGAVYLKSSMARIGLDHALAGWIDPGFFGELTLELHSHRPVTLRKGQRVVQLVLMRLAGWPERDYTETGRYNGQTGPTVARLTDADLMAQ